MRIKSYLDHNTAVAVADGGSACVYLNVGSRSNPVALVLDKRVAGPDTHLKVPPASGQPGETAFANEVAEMVETLAGAGRFNRLVLIAPARFLGDLRAALGDRSRARLIGQFDKDLAKLPPNELFERTAALLDRAE